LQEEILKKMKTDKEVRNEVEPIQAVGTYTEAWSSRVINTLLAEFQNGQSSMPVGFKMKGINMQDKGDGSLLVGFVIARENV